MKEIVEKLTAFLEKIKDDPALSEAFRIAAHELHAELNPPPAKK